MISQWLLVILIGGHYTSPSDYIYKSDRECEAALYDFKKASKPSDLERYQPKCIRQVYEAIKPQVVEQYPGQYGPRR